MEEKERKKTTSLKGEVIINEEIIEIVIDSGAAISVISDKLRRRLKLTIKDKSNISLVLPDGRKTASLGKVEIIMKLFGKEMQVKAEVIDSTKEELLIGTDTLGRYRSNIDFEEKVVVMKTGKEEIVIPVEYEISDIEENSDEEPENESEYDYEEADYRELYGLMRKDINPELEEEFEEFHDSYCKMREEVELKMSVLADQRSAERH